ncbi:reverse transcriptase domain-containing protein [Tanacetum coccineum]
MRTRSQARNRRQQQVRQTSVESPNLEKPNNNQETFNPPIVTMADNRTMAQLLEAPTEGYEDAIVVPEITANNFEIKHGLLNLVQNKQFFGHDKEDPHAHIRYFNKITSTMKFPNVPSTSVKLMLFPFSLEGAARIWLEKEPPRSILTWDDLVSKFINKFFPPSKTTNLRNEITRFQQKFDETFYEAWDRFNDLLRGCPHHGFSELHQLDTFYNALNSNDQDSLNSAAGVERETEVTNDTVPPTNNESAKDVQPPVIPVETQNSEPVVAPTPVPLIPRNKRIILKRTVHALIDVYEGEITFRVGKEAITFNWTQTSRYTANYNHMTANRIDVIELASEEYSQEVSGFSDSVAYGNPSPDYDPIVSNSSPTLTPFGDKGDILILEALLNNEPLPKSLPRSIKIILRRNQGSNSHKRAIAWKLSDIKGVDPEFCTHKILMEEDYEPTVQSQRWVNPKIHDVIKKEVKELLDAGSKLSISLDSP